MNVQHLKAETERLQRKAERLRRKDRPEPVELLKLQREASEIRRKVRRAEELQKMREELKEA